jgi:Phosphatidylinositol-specific phospholipase C, X domain
MIFLRCFFAAFFVLFELHSQCNSTALCQRRYNELTYLTTHNAFNSADNNYLMPNQHFGVTRQLNDGVRALMLDVYDSSGSLFLYHGIPILGKQPFSEVLAEIKIFLDTHPSEIVTIIFECYATCNAIDNEMQLAGLSSYLFEKQSNSSWPTLAEMVSSNKRLVVFSDVNDAGSNQQWYHFMWDHCVETHYSVHDTADFTHEFNRGDSVNDLFIFNHFVTTATFGFGSPSSSAQANSFSFLSHRILENYLLKHKFPNFLTLDFYDLGEGKQVVDWLNSGVLSSDNSSSKKISVFPNPSNGVHYLLTQFPLSHYEITNLSGVRIQEGNTGLSGDTMIKLQAPPGGYVIRFDSGETQKIWLVD